MYITMILIMFFVVPLVLTTTMYKNEAIIELDNKKDNIANNNNTSNQQPLDYIHRLDYTTKVMDDIDRLIMLEVYERYKFDLGMPRNSSNFLLLRTRQQKVCNEIATKIKDHFKKELIYNNVILYEPVFVLKYIIQKTFATYDKYILNIENNVDVSTLHSN